MSKPGMGKSALLGKFVTSYGNSPLHQSNNLLAHFVGLSKDSSDLRSILFRLCHELTRRFPIASPKFVVPQEMDLLIPLLPELLEKGKIQDETKSNNSPLMMNQLIINCSL